ncbi:autotransporter outer membrane beta-barrel domain-containing protein [Helicobacter sp. 13S00477-4]|uniref:autotransporter family protein n=1 Tax=Helicobacter sp. 13S00477-4 TaxID=1905759 RepID=UPI000BA51E94|nr:autotransporter outer membrane beta-barrel domain-containing protein [Helicobacter sp. 13S00477-4]PAF52814.1 hypothetical protein BKH44_01120 [Helicobacter sp. 13S00477-4]
MKKIFLIIGCIFNLYAEQWTTMPSNILLNGGETKTIDVSSNPFYSRGNVSYSTNGTPSSELILQATGLNQSFYNEGKINIKANSKLTLKNFQSYIMGLSGRSAYYIDKNASFQANGKEFTMFKGTSFSNQGNTTLNLSSSLNNSGNISNSTGILIINTDRFNNDNWDNGKGTYGIFETTNNATTSINANEINNFGYTYDVDNSGQIINPTTDTHLNAVSVLKSSSSSTLNLNAPDVYNGIGYKQYGIYHSGAAYLIADNGTINVQNNLASEGSGKGLGAKFASYIVYSQVSAINGGQINIGGDFNNREYSNIYVNNGGSINITGNFTSTINTNIYFSGNASGYGKITAKNIDVKDSKMIFYMGSAKADTLYTLLDATTSLNFDLSVLGIKDVIAQDGTLNIFYKANISQNGNQLQITFQDKNPPIGGGGSGGSSGGGGSGGDSSGGSGSTQESASDILSKHISITQNEKIIIDAIDTQKPIAGFNIRDLGTQQIKNLATNIESGLKNFTDNKNKASRLNFDINKTIIFGRMAKIQSRDELKTSFYEPYVRYAANTIQNQSLLTYTPPEATEQKSLENAIYVGLLGAYEGNTSALGYGYGINIGYDKIINQNLFLGTYFSYIGGGTKLDSLDIQTQGFQIGAYSSINTGIFESNLIVSYNYGFNKSNRNTSLPSNTYSAKALYNTNSLNILAQTAPKFKFGSHTIKPFLGLILNMDFNKPITETTSPFDAQYDFKNDVFLSGMIGLEYQKYISNGYFFIRPSLEYTFYSDLKSTKIIFLDSIISIPAPAKENFASVILGTELPIDKRFFINMNAIAKVSNQKTFIIATTASLKFMF